MKLVWKCAERNEGSQLHGLCFHMAVGQCCRYVSGGLADIMAESSHCFWKCNRNSGSRCVYAVWPEILGRVLYIYLHPPLEADLFIGDSWQLFTAIHDETDGLAHCGVAVVRS